MIKATTQKGREAEILIGCTFAGTCEDALFTYKVTDEGIKLLEEVLYEDIKNFCEKIDEKLDEKEQGIKPEYAYDTINKNIVKLYTDWTEV